MLGIKPGAARSGSEYANHCAMCFPLLPQELNKSSRTFGLTQFRGYMRHEAFVSLFVMPDGNDDDDVTSFRCFALRSGGAVVVNRAVVVLQLELGREPGRTAATPKLAITCIKGGDY